MKLYEIQDELTELEGLLDEYAQEHEGDITDFPFESQYEKFKGMKSEKLLNLAAWFKSVKAEAEAYKAEMKVLNSRKKVAENKMEWLKNFIKTYLLDGEKIKDSRSSLSWRKSESIEIDEDKMDLRKWPDKVKK